MLILEDYNVAINTKYLISIILLGNTLLQIVTTNETFEWTVEDGQKEIDKILDNLRRV